MRADPILGAIIKRKGACRLAERGTEPRLRSLLRALVSQQLSVKAAATIFARVLALFPGDERCPRPEAILQVPLETLRGVGLSRQKASYLHDLSARVVAGTLRLDELDELSDDAGDDGAHRGEGRRPMDRGDDPHLPARPARRAPRGRRGRAQVDSERLRPAPSPDGEAGAAHRRAVEARTARSPRGTSGPRWTIVEGSGLRAASATAAGHRGRPRSLALDSAEPVASAGGIRVSQSAWIGEPPGKSEPAAPGWRSRPSALLACSLARASRDARRPVGCGRAADGGGMDREPATVGKRRVVSSQTRS